MAGKRHSWNSNPDLSEAKFLLLSLDMAILLTIKKKETRLLGSSLPGLK